MQFVEDEYVAKASLVGLCSAPYRLVGLGEFFRIVQPCRAIVHLSGEPSQKNKEKCVQIVAICSCVAEPGFWWPRMESVFLQRVVMSRGEREA